MAGSGNLGMRSGRKNLPETTNQKMSRSVWPALCGTSQPSQASLITRRYGRDRRGSVTRVSQPRAHEALAVGTLDRERSVAPRTPDNRRVAGEPLPLIARKGERQVVGTEDFVSGR